MPRFLPSVLVLNGRKIVWQALVCPKETFEVYEEKEGNECNVERRYRRRQNKERKGKTGGKVWNRQRERDDNNKSVLYSAIRH